MPIARLNQIAAQFISRVMGPAVSLVVFLLIATIKGSIDQPQDFIWTYVLLAIGAGLPFVYFIYLRHRGKISDIDITERTERTPLFLFTIASWCLALLLTISFDLADLVRASFSAGIIAGIIFLGITQRWKISVHSGFWTALSLLMWVLFGTGYLWVLLGLLPIFWARLILHKHTAAQLLAGSVLSAVLFLLIFGWFNLLPIRWA